MSDATSNAVSDPVIRCDQLLKVFSVDDQEIVALQGLELTVAAGERVGVIGASGSGKSTLLNIIGALDRPTAGDVTVAGHDLVRASSLHHIRASVIGFVWQQSGRNLLPYLTVTENVALPRRALGRRDGDRRAAELVAMVGLADRAHHRPVQLSGGQQQRAAIAVALANDPAVLLADEPTGELDSATADEVYGLFERLSSETGLTQLIVSHDTELARHVDRVVRVRDGRVVSEHRESGDGRERRHLVLDRLGRLQLDDEHRQTLGGGPLVEVESADGEVTLRRPEAPPA